MAPDPAGAMRKIPEDARTERGWALARFGDGGWWPAVDRGLRLGNFDDEVVAGLADLLRAAGVPVAWVTSVPSASLGNVIVRLAGRLATELGVRHVALVSRTQDRPPQREMANAVQQAANVRGAFAVTATPPPGTGVLLDDRRHSGWTMAMVGGQLRRAGAQRVVPVALGTLM
jgi:ATP-dependent DNA helicase RecQ